jgi:hypothetical protein
MAAERIVSQRISARPRSFNEAAAKWPRKDPATVKPRKPRTPLQ